MPFQAIERTAVKTFWETASRCHRQAHRRSHKCGSSSFSGRYRLPFVSDSILIAFCRQAQKNSDVPTNKIMAATEDPIRREMSCGQRLAGLSGGHAYHAAPRADGRRKKVTARLIPRLDGVSVPLEETHILWAKNEHSAKNHLEPLPPRVPGPVSSRPGGIHASDRAVGPCGEDYF